MNLSWSKKLFLKINSLVGKKTWFDKIMIFCAHWLIYALGFGVLLWGLIVLTPEAFKEFVKLLLTAVVSALLINWLIALIWKHPRPMVIFPEAKQLVRTYQNWKSFPSDHTTIVFIFFLISIFIGASIWFSIFLLVCVSLVAFGRIYTGVHFPRDIVGGIISGLIFSLLSFWFLENISQPVYIWLVNLFN